MRCSTKCATLHCIWQPSDPLEKFKVLCRQHQMDLIRDN